MREVLEQVGANVRAERSRRGWTQHDAAVRIGLPIATYQRIELGQSGRLDRLYMVADGLGCSIYDLIPPSEEDAPRGATRRGVGIAD